MRDNNKHQTSEWDQEPSDFPTSRRTFLGAMGLGSVGIVGAGSPSQSNTSGDNIQSPNQQNVVPDRIGEPHVLEKMPDVPEWLKLRVDEAMPDSGLQAWIPGTDFRTSSLSRVSRFPSSIENSSSRELDLEGVRNEQISAQIAVISSDQIHELQCSITDLKGENEGKIPHDNIDIRFVGYVPVVNNLHYQSDYLPVNTVISDEYISGNRKPDYVGDPLIETSDINVPQYQAQPIWLTFNIPKSIAKGRYDGKISLITKQQGTVEYDISLKVNPVTIPDPTNYEFFLDVWMNPNAIAEEHDVDPWEEKHWEVLGNYMKDLSDHGQGPILTTIIHEPWQIPWIEGEYRPQTETGYDSMVKWIRKSGEWQFDYDLFDKYVQTGLDSGLGPSINAYSMLVFRGQQRVTYYDAAKDEQVVKHFDAGDDRWEEIWTIFLKDFRSHLKSKGWYDQTYMAFDERPLDLMNTAQKLLKRVTPELENRIRIAGTPDVEPIASDQLSINYQSLSENTSEIAKNRRQNNQNTSLYTWSNPAHPNNLAYSPAVEPRMLPWIAASHNLDGYLRWSYSSYPHDVFQDPVFRLRQGDDFQVYPWINGPISSVRWELLKEGIEDYELLQLVNNTNSKNTLEDAVSLATRNKDGREKELSDVTKARDLVINRLTEQNIITVKTRAIVPGTNQQIRVQIEGSDDFDPHTIDPETLRFGPPEAIYSDEGATPVRARQMGDNLMAIFKIEDTGFTCDEQGRNSASALLTGELNNQHGGNSISGTDTVKIVCR